MINPCQTCGRERTHCPTCGSTNTWFKDKNSVRKYHEDGVGFEMFRGYRCRRCGENFNGLTPCKALPPKPKAVRKPTLPKFVTEARRELQERKRQQVLKDLFDAGNTLVEEQPTEPTEESTNEPTTES